MVAKCTTNVHLEHDMLLLDVVSRCQRHQNILEQPNSSSFEASVPLIWF